MYYAITIQEGLITGKHASLNPITEETFLNSPEYIGQEVISVSEESEYYTGYYL